MTDELPKYSSIETALSEAASKIIAKLVSRDNVPFEKAMEIGYESAANDLFDQGLDAEEVQKALERFRGTINTMLSGATRALSESLHDKLVKAFEEAQRTIPEGPVRLDEVKVQAPTGFAMLLYLNESKHAGFPHVTVQLQDGPINISIADSPRVVAGKPGLRGEAAAIRAVKDHREALLKEWNAWRPDDQKQDNPMSKTTKRK